MAEIKRVGEEDLEELLPRMRGYCDFYGVEPSDSHLLAMSLELIGASLHEGLQLLARDDSGRAIAFATIFWSWSTLRAARIGVMNDLYVEPSARGTGMADELIAACAQACRGRGASPRSAGRPPRTTIAQAVYERVGATRQEWLDYSLEL